MKKAFMAIVLAIFAFLLLGLPTFGQTPAPRKLYALTIKTNVTDAEIYVDNTQLKGNVANVTGGSHVVKVKAAGYEDFNATVTVNANQTMTVELKQLLFTITFKVNPPNALVLVDGTQLKGGTARLAMGAHEITATAKGYQDYQTSFDVSVVAVFNVEMIPLGYPLTINANVKDATVTINGIDRGAAPYLEYLPADTYVVVVSAKGYTDYLTVVYLEEAATISAQLARAGSFATLTLLLPRSFLDTELKPKDAPGLVKIYIDNKHVNTKKEMERIQVAPGKHAVRVVSGAFSVKLGDYDFQQGESYLLEMSMQLSIRPGKAAQP